MSLSLETKTNKKKELQLLDSKMNQLLLLRFLSGMTSIAVDDSHESLKVKLDEFKTYFFANYGKEHRSGMLLVNEVQCETRMIPSIPDEITRKFIESMTQKIRGSDDLYVERYSDNTTKFLNNYKLDGIVEKVLDFLIYYGFQERWFTELSPDSRFVMGCIIKFRAAESISLKIIKKYQVGVINSDMDPLFKTDEHYVSHYNTAFYLEMIKEIKSIDDIPAIEKDVELDRLVESVMRIASAVSGDTFDAKCREIRIITDSINVECLTILISRIHPEYIKGGFSYRGENHLLNHCMVFVLSKLLGIGRDEAVVGKNEKQIAFSYLMRHMLKNNGKSPSDCFWIRRYLFRFESEKEKGYSMWELFNATYLYS